jgi:glycosyltransferase involved in cell wall biosynthesis
VSAPPRSHRVLMTVDAVGGVWRYAMDLGLELAQRGVETTFACFGPPASAAQVAEAEKAGRYVHARAPLDWTAAGQRDLDGIKDRITELADQSDSTLLHLNLPSQAAGLRLELPTIVVSHSCVVSWFHVVRNMPPPPEWQWQEKLNRDGLTSADIVLAPSRSHARMLETCYGPLPSLRVVHNAVRRIPPASTKQPFILAAGRWWDAGKNATLLDAAAASARWPVRMAGSQHGPNGQYQAIERAEALGEIDNSELRGLMRRAAIFASPSIYEPFGLAPLEAASAGAALVLADIPTYRELWGGAAYLAPLEPEGFSAALNRVADDSTLRHELGRCAAARAATFTLKAQADAVLAAYAEAARVHGGARELVA